MRGCDWCVVRGSGCRGGLLGTCAYVWRGTRLPLCEVDTTEQFYWRTSYLGRLVMYNEPMNKSTSGFTIVELLIVIVVIAILAAISIVSYTGIQQSARDSKRKSDLELIVKGFGLWGAENGGDFSGMSAGAQGQEVGWFSRPYDSFPSVKSVLVSGGFLTEGVQDPINITTSPYHYAYMIAPCTEGDESIRIILAKLEIPPDQTVNEQLGLNCTAGNFTSYTGTYGMNYGRVVRL